MDQEKIGKFIATCRKEKGFTQATLAEKLGITDRAISKWETGKSLPDASIMLELCELLDINVNELLTGEKISTENYKVQAEENLLELRKLEELTNKKMLAFEVVLAIVGSIAYYTLIAMAIFLTMPTTIRIILVCIAFVIVGIGAVFSIRIEREAGYYQCPNCNNIYVPTMKAFVWSIHMGWSRKLTCPACGQKAYHKKVLTKNK